MTFELTVNNNTIDDSTTKLLDSFVNDLPDRHEVERQVQTFVVQHAAHHRPVALVTSGGTAADLEVHSVRCLDNFSTGTRGAASVEALLRKGYAVIHLWRMGSASPYGRLVAELLGIPGHAGISTTAVGKLFVGAGDVEQDEEDQMVQAVLANEDPWLSDPLGAHSSSTPSTTTGRSSSTTNPHRANKKMDGTPIALHRRIGYSSRLQLALKERQMALQEGRLLTIPFRSVEEYLAKLQLSTMALQNSQALALVYLAAAVSDFYVPKDQRSEHKIQSGDVVSANGSLTLTLQPVPKVIPLIRKTWAPDAFVCSFKLETDPTILREKAERAVQNYGSHMVVGNILETRYHQVMLLMPPPSTGNYDEDGGNDVAALPVMVQNWPMHTLVHKAGDPDSLENQLVNAVIEAHFDYISKSCNGTFDKAGIEAVIRAHEDVEQKKRQIERDLFWERIQQIGLEWAGVLAGAILSYAISSALRRRMTT